MLTQFHWQDWYMAAKTLAEETALEYAEKNGLTVVTVCPCVVLGPLLQPVVNTSSEFLIYVIKGCLCIFCYFPLVTACYQDIFMYLCDLYAFDWET